MGDRFEHLDGVGFLALTRERERRGVAGRLRPALRELVVSPSDDRAGDDEHEHHCGDDVAAVARPQLAEIVAPEFFVNFAENVAHESPDQPWADRSSQYLFAKRVAIRGSWRRRHAAVNARRGP